MDAMREAYDEVYAYTIGRPGFILQHVVDAHAAQTASDESKPTGIIFALVGLYLHVEKHFSPRRGDSTSAPAVAADYNERRCAT